MEGRKSRKTWSDCKGRKRKEQEQIRKLRVVGGEVIRKTRQRERGRGRES